MKVAIVILILVLSGCASSPPTKEISRYGMTDSMFVGISQSTANTRIYQRDSFGNIQYHKSSEIIINNKIYQVDKFGTVLYHKPSKEIAEK